AFVLVVDSFRFETSQGLPAVRELGPASAFARMRSTLDAPTVPSVRAAFTGVTQRSLFGFLANFVHGGGSIPSLFTQLAASGRHSAVYSDGSFYELRAGITDERSNEMGSGDEQARQR